MWQVAENKAQPACEQLSVEKSFVAVINNLLAHKNNNNNCMPHATTSTNVWKIIQRKSRTDKRTLNDF